MIRITVSYPAAANARFEHDYHRDRHRALLRERLAAHGREIMADVARYTDITPDVLISEVVR